MATNLRIECINTTDRPSPQERIRRFGGPRSDGSRWTLTLAEAIELADGGQFSLYVEEPSGDRVAVVVAVSAAGNKYLKTVADGDQPSNLLALPECP